MKIKGVSVEVHRGDLPGGLDFGDCVAMDTETTGLHPHRDRLCLVQLKPENGVCHIVQMAPGAVEAPNLKALLVDVTVTKLFHYARFDMMMFRRFLGVVCKPVYCTKIASRLVRTYTVNHGLKDLCSELLGLNLSKKQQSSDWAAPSLSREQIEYAANDVVHLHEIRHKLDAMLAREGRAELAEACFEFLATRIDLDLAGWQDQDIFSH